MLLLLMGRQHQNLSKMNRGHECDGVVFLPSSIALDDKRPANELQNACKAFKIWYLLNFN